MRYGKIIGEGNTAIVYEWEEDRVLKLFKHGYPHEAVKKEFHNTRVISNLDFVKPKAYEIVGCEERIGIVYDRVYGESLLDWGMRTGDVLGCAIYMAKLHKDILKHKISNLPDYKKFLKNNILKVKSITSDKREEILQLLDKLEHGNVLCHGDFHPGNLFIADERVTVIDFMNLCQGTFLYDVARTVFLVEYTPVPMQVKDQQLILQLKKKLADLYLKEMNVTRAMIKDYLPVIITARKGECPAENSR